MRQVLTSQVFRKMIRTPPLRVAHASRLPHMCFRWLSSFSSLVVKLLLQLNCFRKRWPPIPSVGKLTERSNVPSPPQTPSGHLSGASTWPWGSLGPEMGVGLCPSLSKAGLWAVTSSIHWDDGVPHEIKDTGVTGEGRSPGSPAVTVPTFSGSPGSGAGLLFHLDRVLVSATWLPSSVTVGTLPPLPNMWPLLPEMQVPTALTRVR